MRAERIGRALLSQPIVIPAKAETPHPSGVIKPKCAGPEFFANQPLAAPTLANRLRIRIRSVSMTSR